MAFETGETNAGSGGLRLAVNTFTDTDTVIRTLPFSGLAFGVMDAVPTIVSAANGLPVTLQGTCVVSAVTELTNALPAGSNVIGHVITDTGSTTAVTGTVMVVNSGTFAVQSTQSGTWSITNISGTVSLPTGASTAANQATEIASLASIDGKIVAVNTGAVVVSSSALPSGAATAARQPALGTAGTASADVLTVQGRSGMTALVVDGSGVTQPVSGTFWQATQPVSGTVAVSGVSGTVAATQSGTWTIQPGNTANTTAWLVTGTGGSFPVTDSGGSLTVDNSTLAVVGGGTEAAAMRVTIATDSTGVVSIDDNGGSLTVDGTVAVSGSVAVTGTFWQATQPVSLASVPSHAVTNAGTFAVQVDGTALTRLTDIETNTDSLSVVGNGAAATAQRVTIANDSTGTVAVSGTVTANIGTVATLATAAKQDTGNTNLATIAGAVSGTEMQVDVLTMPTVTVNAHAVTNAGTFVVQENGAALTSLQLIDDAVTVLGTDTYTEATSKGLAIGAVRRDADTTLVNTTNEFGPLQMDANGRLKVEAFSGETLPVSLTSTTVTGTVAVTQSGTWDEVGINDSGNSITVDNGGTFAVQAAQSGTWTVTGVGGTFPVTGTFWQATQPTSIADGSDVTLGTKTDAKSTATDTTSVSVVSILKQISASVQAPPSQAVTNTGTFAVQATLQTGNNVAGQFKLTDGTDIADVLDLTNSNPLTVAIVDGSGDQITSFGGGTQYTEDAAAAANPVGTAMIGVRADSLAGLTTTDGDNVAARMTDKGEQYVKHVDAIPITDNSGSITVDNGGTFAVQAAQSGTWNVGTVTTLTGTTTLTPGTGATNLGKAEDGAHTTGDVGVMALAVRSNTAASTSGTDGDYQPLITNTTGHLWVDASGQTLTVASHAVTNAGTFATQSVCTNAGTFAVQATVAAGATTIGKAEDVASADADVGVPAMAVRKATPANTSGTDGDYEMLQMSVGRLWVSATVDAALPAGTNAIGKLASNTGVTIGAVEIAAAQTLATVTTLTTCTTVTTLTGGGVAHDGADSGSPHKIGAKATASVLGATPVAAADRTDLFAGTDGVLITRPYTSLEDIISETKTNTDGASTAMTGGFAATASQRIYLTTLAISNSSATAITVDIRDGSGGSVLFTVPAPAGAGVVISFPVPIRFSSNTAAAFDGSAAATTLTVSMIGFKSKA